MNPNLLYKIALKKYEKASKAIDSLTKDVAGVFPDYDNKRALISFDYLLQCTLLKQALADGTISENELEFIKGISNHGDVLEEIKSSFDDTNVGGLIKKTTWNDIYYLGPVAQTALVNAISNFFISSHGSFPSRFADFCVPLRYCSGSYAFCREESPHPDSAPAFLRMQR